MARIVFLITTGQDHTPNRWQQCSLRKASWVQIVLGLIEQKHTGFSAAGSLRTVSCQRTPSPWERSWDPEELWAAGG